MRAVQATDYGSHLNLSVNTIPEPMTIPKGKILIQTQAVALAPGDARVLSGKCKALNGPPSFPYIPGGDSCGIVKDMGGNDPAICGFDVGDRIAARFTEGPRGALAQNALISPKMAYIVPDNVLSEDAAALASSASIALHLSRRIKKDERVLILGAGGGVGSHLCQFLRLKGVQYIAGVSSDPDSLMKEPISCHNALDYNKKDILDLKEWGTDVPFDVIVDLCSCVWPRLLEQSRSKSITVVKSAKEGGRYLTTTPDEPWFQLNGIGGALGLFMFTPLWRAMKSRLWKSSSLPAFTFAMSIDNDLGLMEEVFSLAHENKLKACIDHRGPFDFTTEGVQEAFKIQESRHYEGKVVIRVPMDSE